MKTMNKIITYILVVLISLTQYVVVSAKTYYTGPKGGCYYFTSSGKKAYVSHQLCSRNDEGTNGVYNSKTKKTYYTGPEGGCFYYSTNLRRTM